MVAAFLCTAMGLREWLRHAYPQECPQPSTDGHARQLWPLEWARTGRPAKVDNMALSAEVFCRLENDPEAACTSNLEEMAWDEGEEILGHDHVPGVEGQHGMLWQLGCGVARLQCLAAVKAGFKSWQSVVDGRRNRSG